ncbi:MAG: hypothetical protein Q8O00_11235 [Holophaga sp.]|nr:hypothetical protein [Holophaga sp.]
MRERYVASATMARFHRSPAKFRGIMGPVGSGKSSACCMELMRLAHLVPPNTQGERRSRYCVIRNTYRELKDTTIKTWLEWFPETSVGLFNWSDMVHRIRLTLADGTKVDTEVMFRALDRPRDVRKVLSLDLTGAWFNEAREIAKAIVDAVDDRCGRFPPADEVVARACLIADTNPPDTDHWWARLDIDTAPEERAGWEFFTQPGGLMELEGKFVPNPLAENITHLRPNYYVEKLSGKSKDHIRVYYCARYGFVTDGKPVIHEYHDETHTAREALAPVRGLPLIIGLDWGLTPAAAIAQRMPNGRWIVLDELVGTSIGARRFAEVLKSLLHERYPGFPCHFWGDPAGMARAQTDERTVFEIVNAVGLPARPAPTNDATIRREALGHACSIIIDGKPGLLVSPRCVVLRKGAMGGYCYKRLQVAGAERYHDAPDKNQYSHVVEALEYAMVGGGEGRALVRRPGDGKPRQQSADFSANVLHTASASGRQQSAD